MKRVSILGGSDIEAEFALRAFDVDEFDSGDFRFTVDAEGLILLDMRNVIDRSIRGANCFD